ncbi:hypothetical protein F5144DRAFT_589592 [Chaetomium tenue]|uniref:Uncharacterized protein n=1 Tax=Chaetomium tenue TaxID=1854479 RepID=A0ACB7PST1_9PEZI|nr:hypothetical protein F5144DRAFT_589592 [Chaetomium globosum]
MTNKSGKKFWQVTIIRKRLGTALHGSPLKPFAKGIKGFKTFCKSVFRGSALRKSELETINNLGVATASPDEIHTFTPPPEPVASEYAHNGDTSRPEVPSTPPTKVPALAEVVSEDDNDTPQAITTVATECALPAEGIPDLTTEPPRETPQVQNAVIIKGIASEEEDEAVASTQLIAVPVESASLSLDTKPDAVAEPTPAPETYTIIDTIIDTPSDSPAVETETPEPPIIVCTEPVAIECTLDVDIKNTPEPVQAVSSQEDAIAILDTEVISLDKEELTIRGTQPVANTDHVVALVEESGSDNAAATPEMSDNEDDFDSETEIGSEAEEDLNTSLGIHVTQDILHKNEELTAIPMPVIFYQVIHEDDFDACVSSIQGPQELNALLESDSPWLVPQIIEKGKLNRQMVHGRLPNRRTALGHYRDLNLEKAARELVLDIPAPVRVITRAASPTVIKETEIPTAQEVEIPTTKETPPAREVETPKKTRAAQPIPVAIGLSSRNHSRSSSGSSAGSVDASVHSEPCPGTPLTEYSMTPTKDEATPACSTEEARVADPVISYLARLRVEVTEQPVIGMDAADADDEGDEGYDEYADDNFSDSSSEFIEDPEPLDGYDQDDSILEPFERPSAPEPTDMDIDYYNVDYDVRVHDYAELEAAKGSGLVDFRGLEYGHRCVGQRCDSYFNYFGWWQYPDGGAVVTPEAATEYLEYWEETMAVKAARASKAIRVAMETQHLDWQVVSYSGPILQPIHEDEELVIREAAGGQDCAVEEDDETDIEAETEAMDRFSTWMERNSVVSQDKAVEQERERAEAARAASENAMVKRAEAVAEVGNVSWWDRDPLSTSKLSWADIDELDDEPAPTEEAAAANTASRTDAEGATKPEVSFWDCDPFYISKSKWVDMMEEDELAPIGGYAAAKTASHIDAEDASEANKVSF